MAQSSSEVESRFRSHGWSERCLNRADGAILLKLAQDSFLGLTTVTIGISTLVILLKFKLISAWLVLGGARRNPGEI